MPTLRVSHLTPVSVFSLIVSGCCLLISEYSPVQAKMPDSSPISSQTTLPYLYEMPLNEQALPQLQPVKFYQSPGTQYSQYNQNFNRYFVYVDSSNPQILQRVRQIESSAYIRNYNGRNVIQSGVFNGQSNAQNRVRELALNGITGARIVNSENIELTPSYSAYNNQTYTNNYQQEKRNSYYVVVPGNGNNLRALGTEIRQKVNTNINVFRRNQPRGAHIAVGPFRDRSEAEQWNSYLKNSGHGNARLYYGK
jgi:hypothetical protein